MDWRIFFVTMPQGKTSHFPTAQTRNHPKQRAARCYVTVYSPFTAAPRETQTAFGFRGNTGFNCSSRGSFLTPRVCPAHTAQMCLQQRGVLERADRTATPHPKSVFSPKKTKAEPWCRRNSLVLHNPLQYLCGDLENISVVSFPPPEHRWKSLLCTHTSLTHTLHPGGPGCPFGSHGTAQQTHPEEPFQSNTKEQSTRILLNSTHVSFLFSWNWVHLSHLPFLSQTTLGEVEGLFWVNSQLTTKLENNSCIYLSTASKQFLFPSTTSHCPSVPHFLPGQHHLYILAP